MHVVSAHTHSYTQVYILPEGSLVKCLTYGTYWSQLKPSVTIMYFFTVILKFLCLLALGRVSCSNWLVTGYKCSLIFFLIFFFLHNLEANACFTLLPQCIWRFRFDIVIEFRNII